MLKMDEVNKIRKLFKDKEKSKNELSKQFNRSWNTIDHLIEATREELAQRGIRPNRAPLIATEAVKSAVEWFLIEEELKNIPRKQRYTAKVIYEELSKKGLFSGSYRTMRKIVRDLRKERGRLNQNTFLPMEYELGSKLQIDHGEVEVIISGQALRAYLFVASVPGYPMRFCQVMPIKAKEAWGLFHEQAFSFYGGIFPEVVYDNDSVLVKEIIGRERNQTAFSLELEEHYDFKSYFCSKGAGHEKGTVENSVGYCRRNYLAGIKAFESWDSANDFLLNECVTAISNAEHYRTKEPIITYFNGLTNKLQSLSYSQEWVTWEDVKINSFQLASHKEHLYSVPERYVGSDVRVCISVFEVKIYHQQSLIACHQRKFLQGEDSLILDHYLDQLKHKPGAFWDSKAVKQHNFSVPFLELWNRLYSRFSLRDANGEFVKILLLNRTHNFQDLTTAIELALSYNAIGYDAINNLLHQLITPSLQPPSANWFEDNLPHLSQYKQDWSFDLSAYKSLEGGVPC